MVCFYSSPNRLGHLSCKAARTYYPQWEEKYIKTDSELMLELSGKHMITVIIIAFHTFRKISRHWSNKKTQIKLLETKPTTSGIKKKKVLVGNESRIIITEEIIRKLVDIPIETIKIQTLRAKRIIKMKVKVNRVSVTSVWLQVALFEAWPILVF